MTKDEIFDKIDDVYSEHDGGTIYLSDERTERLKEIIQQAINFIPCCTELKTEQECYKTGKTCMYKCKGLCKDACQFLITYNTKIKKRFNVFYQLLTNVLMLVNK